MRSARPLSANSRILLSPATWHSITGSPITTNSARSTKARRKAGRVARAEYGSNLDLVRMSPQLRSEICREKRIILQNCFGVRSSWNRRRPNVSAQEHVGVKNNPSGIRGQGVPQRVEASRVVAYCSGDERVSPDALAQEPWTGFSDSDTTRLRRGCSSTSGRKHRESRSFPSGLRAIPPL